MMPAVSPRASSRMSCEYRLNAMIPGTTMRNGISSFMNAANTMPFWPSASDADPSVRCVMYWLRPQ